MNDDRRITLIIAGVVAACSRMVGKRMWFVAVLLFSSAYLSSQSAPIAGSTVEFEPGIPVPSTGTVFILSEGKTLQRVRHSTVKFNPHVGSNGAKQSLAPFVFKPKASLDLQDDSPAIHIKDANPVFFVHYSLRQEEEREPDLRVGYGLVRIWRDGTRRVIATATFNRAGLNPIHEFKVVDSKTERLNSEWLKISPTSSLRAGEYAVVAIPSDKSHYLDDVYEFAVDQ